MSRFPKLFVLLSMALLPGSAYAKECQAKFTANAAAVENRESVIKKGTILTYATQYRIDRRTNDASVCFKGGYCYPAQKIKLSCKVDWKSGESFDGDPTVIYYYK